MASTIEAGLLDAATLACNFADAHAPLSPARAAVEADRCYYCHDAPCIEACPTGIDIPGFIRRIAAHDLKGAGETILSANILGGSCARVCPTEILCEGACVRTAAGDGTVEIGALQRHATDHVMARGLQPFGRAPATGRHIAIVGAGPAGLACAHALAMRGHEVTIHEARPRPGGLNEYGVAAYKLAGDFAQEEIAWLLGIGGITIEHGHPLASAADLDALRAGHDAVFLALGHAGVRRLSGRSAFPGESLDGVEDAIAFIARLRSAPDKSTVAVGRRVVVIGGGNTAIDAAMQARRLGAQEVTLLYRRGPDAMSATQYERDWALTSGIRILFDAVPHSFDPDEDDGERVGTVNLFVRGEPCTLPADMVLKAIGQFYEAELGEALAIEDGRIAVDAQGRTSLDRVYAGGDCTKGADLTVVAVADGKRAALAIDADLKRNGS